MFICFQLIFHTSNSLQLVLALDNTKRVFFCTNTEVDFELMGYVTFWNTFGGSATALSLVAPTTRTDLTRFLKGRPDGPFVLCQIFSTT